VPTKKSIQLLDSGGWTFASKLPEDLRRDWTVGPSHSTLSATTGSEWEACTSTKEIRSGGTLVSAGLEIRERLLGATSRCGECPPQLGESFLKHRYTEADSLTAGRWLSRRKVSDRITLILAHTLGAYREVCKPDRGCAGSRSQHESLERVRGIRGHMRSPLERTPSSRAESRGWKRLTRCSLPWHRHCGRAVK